MTSFLTGFRCLQPEADRPEQQGEPAGTPGLQQHGPSPGQSTGTSQCQHYQGSHAQPGLQEFFHSFRRNYRL